MVKFFKRCLPQIFSWSILKYLVIFITLQELTETQGMSLILTLKGVRN